MEEKRRSKRLALNGEIVIKEMGSELAETTEIEITDASSTGLGFKTDKQLTIGNNYEAHITILYRL